MDLMDYRRKIIANSPHLMSAEGAVVSFSDGADLPLKSLNVDIEPVQSGTGDPSPTNVRPISGWNAVNIYDDPIYPDTINWNQKISNREVWPAGGSLTWNNNEVEFTVTELVDAAWKSRISFLGDYGFYLTANDKFIISFDVKPAHTRTMGVYIMVRQGSGANKYIATQTLTAGQWNHVDIINSVNADVDMAYLQISVGAMASNGYAVGDKDLFRNVECFNITQMFGANHEPSTISDFRAMFPNDYYSYNEGEKTLVSAVNGMPYIHVAIDLGQTVYGGTLNPLTGVLTVDRRFLLLSSSGSGTYAYNSRYGQLRITGLKAMSNTIENICSHYKSFSGSFANLPDKSFMASSSTIAIKDSNYTSLASWKSYLDAQLSANTPVQGCVILQAEEVETIQLTPQQVRSLYGNNTIFADTGNVDLEYWAHP